MNALDSVSILICLAFLGLGISHGLIKSVSSLMPFEIENDPTVIQALEKIKPQVFAKGGDRVDAATIPEWDTCQKNNIEVVTGVGLPKYWSSSDFLKNWNIK